MKKVQTLLLVFLLSVPTLHAQSNFDLVVVDTKGKGKRLNILPETARLLTDRTEYDNQPDFINEYQLAFSAADQEGNHDIIIYNFQSGKFTNLTKTDDRSEFSPTLTDCGQYVSAVVAEPDGNQRLWLYPTNFGEPELLYDDIQPVGYYDWYDNRAAMFILGDSNRLIYVWGKGNLEEIAPNIGRSIKRRPKTSEITYLDRDHIQKSESGEQVAIKSYDLEKKTGKELGYSLPGSQDLIWIDKDHLLMAKENEIFLRNARTESWTSIGTVSSPTHHQISRMAYSPDLNKLVVVMQRK